MAYSDYGGYAYRNGAHVIERSDAVLSPEGIKATPGMWPGWKLPEGRAGDSFHVLLGDGPIFVGLYKQSTVRVFRLGEEIEIADIAQNLSAECFTEFEGRRYLDTLDFIEDEEPTVFELDGHRLSVFWRHEDNYYVYARLEQPDGTVWYGWSGYGVGAGFDDGEYGYSTKERGDTLRSLWPDAVLP